jgi:hypothetical protein
MDNTAVPLRAGEKRVIYATVTVAVGTVTVAAPTFDLLDNNDAVLASGIAATGFDAAAASVRVWYDLDTTTAPGSLPVLLPGNYRIKWNIPVAASGDSLARTERPSTLVVVTP